ncbi:hypothetical protein TRVA0_013S01662 [Trichomonascus vanleenenianus]|uniref:lysophospholipid acyltransferase family protein n=1 Tax=Trichomonascus vanleenenianus TaxID=2268995 RepID=UPI003ECAFF2B
MKEDSTSDVDLLRDGEGEDKHTLTSNLVVEFTRFRENPYEFMKTLALHLHGSSWRAYEDYTGHKLYYPGLSESVFEQTLNNPITQAMIDDLAERALATEQFETTEPRERRKNQVVRWLSESAQKIISDMMCKFDNKPVLQFMYYCVAQIFARSYHQGVHVNPEQLDRIRAKALELQAKKQSMIFLPCHKSHIDYIAIQFICFRMGLSLPVVVAGDNLNFAVIGPMLQQVGAMYIRRSFGEDKLYQAIVQAYIETVLSNGINFECFVEGTRSRTGKLLPPKFGILKYILDAILSGRVEDTWIVPVSTQYDKVAEAEAYATELLGKEKKRESFADFLNASKVLSLKLGRVDVRFQEPWSLKSYVMDQLNKMTASQSLSTVTPDIRSHILRSLGYRVLADINNASVTMPTSLIGTALLTSSERGISFRAMVSKVKWLINRVHEAGGRVGTISRNAEKGNLDAVVDNALKVLGSDLVGREEKGLLEPIYYVKDAFKLSYYRNQVIHLFASEAIVTVAMYTVIRQSNGNSTHISKADLLEPVKFLSRLLSKEFVYGPNGLETNLDQTLAKLEAQDVVELDNTGTDLYVKLTSSLYPIGNDHETFDFYCYLVWPFMDGFWLASVILFALTPKLNEKDSVVWVEEKELLNIAQMLGKTFYHQGHLTYYEAVNKELLKSALNEYHEMGIIIKQKSLDRKGKPVMVAIAKDWVPARFDVSANTTEEQRKIFRHSDILPTGKLYSFSELISESRHKTLRHHDMASTIKGADMLLLRVCSQLGSRAKTRTVTPLTNESKL